MSYQLRLFLSLCCLVSLTTSASAQELDPSQDQWYQHYKTQENIPKPGKMLLNTDKEPELTKGFEPLSMEKTSPDGSHWVELVNLPSKMAVSSAPAFLVRIVPILAPRKLTTPILFLPVI